MPRIAVAAAGLLLVVFSIGFNVVRYPKVWEMAAVPCRVAPQESPQTDEQAESATSVSTSSTASQWGTDTDAWDVDTSAEDDDWSYAPEETDDESGYNYQSGGGWDDSWSYDEADEGNGGETDDEAYGPANSPPTDFDGASSEGYAHENEYTYEEHDDGADRVSAGGFAEERESTSTDYTPYDDAPYDSADSWTGYETPAAATPDPIGNEADLPPGMQRLPPVDPTAPTAPDPFTPRFPGDPIPFYPTVEAK